MTAKKPGIIPPPPATGGSHVWDSRAEKWVTREQTIQVDDPQHPDNVARRAAEGAPVGEN